MSADLAELQEMFRQGPSDELLELAREVVNLRAHRDSLNSELKTVKDRLKSLEEELHSRLVAAGLKGLKLDTGHTITPTMRVHASMRDPEAVLQWLREIGLGGLIQETVNRQTFEAQVRRLLEEGEDIPDCVNIYEKPVLQVRR